MAFWTRIFSFLAILLAGLWLGWEYAIAGVIFSLALHPQKYEYLLLGLILDALFLFPKGFFTILAVALIFLAGALEKSLQRGELSSFLARLSILLLLSAITFGGFFTVAFWPDISRPLYITIIYLVKTFSTLAILLILYRTLGYDFTGKNHTNELRFFGTR